MFNEKLILTELSTNFLQIFIEINRTKIFKTLINKRKVDRNTKKLITT